MPVSHFSILFASSFPFDVARVIHADTQVNVEGHLSFLREGVEVFRIASAHVSALSAHASHRDAEDAVRAHREARAGAGAASGHISELGAAPRRHPSLRDKPQRGALAEGFNLRVSEHS